MSPSAGLQTFINDLQRQKDRRISVMVKCIDTTRIENGVLCCMHPAEGFWLFKGSSRHNFSINHYGGPFGDESRQTSIPSCMNKMHRNYLWSSKTVPGSTVCDRAGACSVHNRVSSNIAKVDRTGQVVSCGPTHMESAIMSKGGRVPDTVVGAAASCVSEVGMASENNMGGSMLGNNIISSRYIAAATKTAPMYAAGAYAPSISSVYSSSSGLWGFASHMQSAATSTAPGSGYSDGRYTYVDEEYMNCMQKHMNWDRDNGTIHLMPIAVVYQEDVL